MCVCVCLLVKISPMSVANEQNVWNQLIRLLENQTNIIIVATQNDGVGYNIIWLPDNVRLI